MVVLLHLGPKERKNDCWVHLSACSFLFFLPDDSLCVSSPARSSSIPPIVLPFIPFSLFLATTTRRAAPAYARSSSGAAPATSIHQLLLWRTRIRRVKGLMTPLFSVAAKEPQEENKALTIDKKLMTKLGSLQSTYGPGSGTKAEKQGTPVQVAFGRADSSIPRTFPTPRSFSSGTSAVKLPKEHNEPWGYTCTNGPVSLPLRRPNSGDTEILDGRAQDGELSAAEELGLMERVDTHTPQLLFFQFPKTLPLPRQADADADTNMNMSAKSMGDNRKRRLDSIHGCGLKELPGGFMGKILVFKSGKVKMTLGDVLFDVSAGSNCIFPQEVVAINTREKHCCGIGDIGKCAIITPDINSLLGSVQI